MVEVLVLPKVEARENRAGGLGFKCEFIWKGIKYIADLCFTPDHGNEVMIFKIDEDGELDWDPVYENRGIEVSEEVLVNEIKTFVENMENEEESR